ncbi:MAG: ABC transporter ATP-binding protein/permease, partial [Spirochaetales bacterium]|nr:ABC transporter ATP-binding protein/permease [Spirochaetales bacterium]
ATMIGVAVVIAVGRLGWRFFIHGSSRRIEAELRARLYDHLLTLPSSYYQQVKTGDLMARATNDMNAIRMAVGMALVAFFDGLFMTVAILSILIGQNPRLALLTVIPLPIITVFMVMLGGRIGRLFRSVQEGFSAMSDQTQEAFSGIRVIKAFVKEEYFLRRFGDANDTYQRRNMELVRIWGVFFPLVGFLSGLTLLMLLWFGGRSLIAGEISTGNFVTILSYLQMLIWPMMGAGFTINMLQRGAASLGRINAVLHTEPSIASPPDAVTRPIAGTVEIRNLTYRFSDSAQTALNDVNVRLERGATLGILGRTGSGKSTLVSMLPRLLDPPPGTVFVDGTDIRDFELDTLRRGFAVVPQSAFLFSASIAENIRFGRPDASDEEVMKVGTTAAIDTDIADFPDRWDTIVGERGVTLSGGQRQRIALARALLIDAEVLILDDALSAVDSDTEERILTELAAIGRKRTTVVVSNRVSTLASADLIVVLEGGEVVQRGTHRSLTEEPGFYREIYRLQQRERARERR